MSRWTRLLVCAALSAGCFDPQTPITVADTEGTSGLPASTGSTGAATSSSDDDPDPPSTTETSTVSTETGDASTTAELPGDVATVDACSSYDPQCPEGMKCNAYSDGAGGYALGCFPLARETVEPGEPCEVFGGPGSGVDDCAAFSTCWDVASASSQGVCRRFCSVSAETPVCENPTTACASIDGVVDLCLETCDPLLQACGDGYACKPVGETFVCSIGLGASAGDYGDACDSFEDCNPGLFCTTEGCTSFCDLDDPSCPDADECMPWFEPGQTPPGYEDVGRCVL